MKAVVALGLNRISVEEVTLDPPKTGEVLVKMGATGVCHSDLSAVNRTLPMALPLLLGHEGAGVVQIAESMPLNACLFAPEAKTVKGSFYGNTNFKVDMPNLLELYQAGRLDLDGMVTHTYSIDDAVRAFEDLESGANARGVIVYD